MAAVRRRTPAVCRRRRRAPRSPRRSRGSARYPPCPGRSPAGPSTGPPPGCPPTRSWPAPASRGRRRPHRCRHRQSPDRGVLVEVRVDLRSRGHQEDDATDQAQHLPARRCADEAAGGEHDRADRDGDPGHHTPGQVLGGQLEQVGHQPVQPDSDQHDRERGQADGHHHARVIRRARSRTSATPPATSRTIGTTPSVRDRSSTGEVLRDPSTTRGRSTPGRVNVPHIARLPPSIMQSAMHCAALPVAPPAPRPIGAAMIPGLRGIDVLS